MGGTYAAGSLIMGGSGTLKAAELEHHINVLGEAVRDGSPEHIDAAAGLLMPLLAPMTAGCLPLGVLMAAIFYYTLRPAVAASRRAGALTSSAAIDPAYAPASSPWIDNCPASAHLTGMSSSQPLASSIFASGVNIDHVATIRNARGGGIPIRCAPRMLAIEAGADGITAHLREDRRHISDDDIAPAQARADRPLNLRWRRPRRCSPSRLRHRAARVLPRAGEARGAHDRGRARRRAAATTISRRVVERTRRPPASAYRCSSSPTPEPSRPRAAIGADSRRIAHRRLLRARARGRCRTASTRELDRLAARRALPRPRRPRGPRRPRPRPSTRSRRVARMPQIVELNIGHFLIGEAIFVGLRDGDPRACAR